MPIVIPDDDPFDAVHDVLPGTHVVDRVAFTTALNKVLPAAATDDLVEMLQYAHIALERGDVTLTTTDRYRLAREYVRANGTTSATGLLPAKLATEVLKHATGETLEFSGGDDTDPVLTMSAHGVTLRCSKPDAYPNVDFLLDGNISVTARLNTRDLFKAANRVAALNAHGRAAEIEILDEDSDTLRFLPATDHGRGTAPMLSAAINGYIGEDGLTIGINPKYLLDTLKTITAETVTLGFTRACLRMDPGPAGTLEGMSRFQTLSDAQWELIAPMLPTRTGRAGRPFSDARTIVEAIIYQYRCGIPWRDLPEVYGSWQTVWTWHRRMA